MRWAACGEPPITRTATSEAESGGQRLALVHRAASLTRSAGVPRRDDRARVGSDRIGRLGNGGGGWGEWGSTLKWHRCGGGVGCVGQQRADSAEQQRGLRGRRRGAAAQTRKMRVRPFQALGLFRVVGLGRCRQQWGRLGSQSIRLFRLYSDLGRLVVLNLLVLLFDLHLFDKWIGTPGEHVPARGLPAALSGPESRGPDKARADCKAFKPEPSFQHQTARGSLGAEWEI